MYIAVPGNQLKRIRLRRLHQDNSRWARRSAHSQRRYGTSRFNFGQRWPSRLVATAAEDRLNIRRNPHTSFAAVSDCRTIAIYEYTAFCNGPGDVKSPRVIVTPPRLVGQGKDQETKPVLHFKGTAKPMILNKTN